MADFRTVQTRMWREDEWFQNLETDARLLWVYLFTNPSANAAGLYRLPIRTIAFESGIDLAAVERLLGEFAEANKAHYEAGIVYVVKMQALQHGDISWQVATRIAADVDAIPDGRLKTLYLERYGYPIVTESLDGKGKITRSITYRYPIDAVSIPHRYTDTDTDTDTDTPTVTETREDAPVVVVSPYAMAVRNFENEIGLVSGSYADDMKDMWALLESAGTTGWWDKSIKLAVEANKRSWSYMRGILSNCLQEGHAPGERNGKGGQHATSGRNGSGKSQGFGLRRQPGDVAAPDPTDEEKREWAEWRLQQATSAGRADLPAL